MESVCDTRMPSADRPCRSRQQRAHPQVLLQRLSKVRGHAISSRFLSCVQQPAHAQLCCGGCPHRKPTTTLPTQPVQGLRFPVLSYAAGWLRHGHHSISHAQAAARRRTSKGTTTGTHQQCHQHYHNIFHTTSENCQRTEGRRATSQEASRAAQA